MIINNVRPSVSRRGRLVRVLAATAALGLVAAACGSDAGSDSGGSVEGASDEVIKLAVNPWNGSAVNVAVASQLISSEIGQTVEVVEVDENAQWAAINTADLSASLEVWPSGHAQNVVDFIDNADGNVVNAGLLGPVGKIGWYIPTYMVDQHPELATWEGFKDPELAKLFATAETGDKGQFLGGDPSFVQFDEAIIANLGLELEVVYAGSEEAILAALDSAISREEPILIYLWTPHSAHNKYDLTEVKLPDYSDACAATAPDGVDCDYPADNLFKIISADLTESSPAVASLLTKMNYTTADQVEMLASVETDGMSVEDAAASWIEAHPDTWKAWLS
ncbi:ABC transporter substrate-binding protein [Ilumatobacter sp.]|uniref:ABC transporter substrate-binding protein n=1 Tax=Ilumatobacter sp. TaxID=1967498 RepID=UPI003751AF6B